MPRGNPSPKLAITVNPEIHKNILAAVALWEEQHGRFTAEEMNEAHRSVRAQLRTSRTALRPA